MSKPKRAKKPPAPKRGRPSLGAAARTTPTVVMLSPDERDAIRAEMARDPARPQTLSAWLRTYGLRELVEFQH